METGHFPLRDLLEADEIFLTNSIKGIISVNDVQGRPLKEFPSADQLRVAYWKEITAQTKI